MLIERGPSDAFLDLVSRWYRLRKVGLCVPLLVSEHGNLYTFDPVERWDGPKQRVSQDDLRAMVEAGEAQLRITRKKADQEVRPTRRAA